MWHLQEKSKLDWNQFKKAEGIEQELKIHNKGKSGSVSNVDKFILRVSNYNISMLKQNYMVSLVSIGLLFYILYMTIVSYC